MKKIFSLVRVMLKMSYGDQFNTGFKSNSRAKSLILFGFIGIYLFGIITLLSNSILDTLIPLGQSSLLIYLIYNLSPIYILVVSILSVPNILYYAKDNASYFVFPLKPWEITLSKYLTALLQSIASLMMLILPVMLAYLVRTNASLLTWILGMLSLVAIPILPLSVAIILVILLFTFMPFFRNKTLFTYISIGITLIGTLILSQLSQILSIDQNAIQNIADIVNSQNNQLFKVLGAVFPTTQLLSDAVVNAKVTPFLITLVISFLVILVSLVIAQPLYFKGALSFTESSRNRSKTNTKKLLENSNRRSIVRTFAQYDVKNILRTPVFFMNYYLPSLLMPAILIFSLYTAVSSEGAIDTSQFDVIINQYINQYAFLDQVLFIFSICFVVGLFFANMSSSATTSISREGITMSEFIMLPIDMYELVKAKLITSISSGIVTPVLSLILVTILLKLSPIFVLVGFISILCGAIIVNLCGILVDMTGPRLVWQNEQDAVKGNWRQLIVTIPFIMIPLIFIGIIIALPPLVSFIIIIIVIPILIYFLHNYVQNYARTQLIRNIQEA